MFGRGKFCFSATIWKSVFRETSAFSTPTEVLFRIFFASRILSRIQHRAS